MKLGICGLGRMGAALPLQALEKGHEVVIAELGDRFEVSLAGAAGTRCSTSRSSPVGSPCSEAAPSVPR